MPTVYLVVSRYQGLVCLSPAASLCYPTVIVASELSIPSVLSS